MGIEKMLYAIALVLVPLPKSTSAAFFTEYGAIDDKNLLEQGFSCKSVNSQIGVMKEGEEKLNYASEVCGKIKCEEGIISYTTCGDQVVGEGCYIVSGKPDQPYPDCCNTFRCSQ